MYNIYDALYEEDDDNILIIDNNDKVAQKIQEYNEERIRRRELRYQKMVDDFFKNLEYDEEGKPLFEMDEDGYAIIPMDDDGHPLIQVDDEGNILNMPAEEEPEPEFVEGIVDTESEPSVEVDVEEILENARLEAEDIIAQAQMDADAMRQQAEIDGHNEGYMQGMQEGADEFRNKQQELEAEHRRMQEEFVQKQQGMEQELVETICDIVERVFLIDFSASKQVVYHLAENAILNIENSNVFIIKVNEENAAALKEKKEALQEKIGSEAQLDIVIDPLMEDSSCVIETDGGVFDCGMDTQLTNLLNKLKALS